MEPIESYNFYIANKNIPTADYAKGIRIWDKNGKEYIDGCSGAVICNIGYGQEKVLEAIKAQAEKTFFAYRLHFENQPAMDLSKKLVELTASHLNRVFFVSGGSEAVESAMKLCRQYFYDRGEGSRHIFICRTPSYHGCTLGTLSLTAYAPLEAPFRPMMKAYPKIPAPNCYRCGLNLTYPNCGIQCAKELERTILEQGPENVAAFVAEPIGGASTGAVVPPDGYFDIIRETCTKFGVLLILDEVMTGFGRTGKLFAYEHWDVEADIICLSKGMASGYVPLGAIMARKELVNVIMEHGGFKHGFTYAGNPMACAIGLQVLDIIEEQGLVDNAKVMGDLLKAELEALAIIYPMIGQVRGKGLLLALELVKNPETKEPFPASVDAAQTLTDIAFNEGLVIYPRKTLNGLEGDHVLISPPLVITAADVKELINRLDKSLEEAVKRFA
ncbi:aminotransferase class III-fold pyridoxal phosphate-dependent enzyme [bacterium]|nr:aminotransferase class III-fold pyridoxal phosphate-dependent enzyme [bacterium]